MLRWQSCFRGAGRCATAQMSLDDPATWRAIPDDQLRIVLARRDGRWVSAARAGEDVTIDDVAGGGYRVAGGGGGRPA